MAVCVSHGVGALHRWAPEGRNGLKTDAVCSYRCVCYRCVCVCMWVSWTFACVRVRILRLITPSSHLVTLALKSPSSSDCAAVANCMLSTYLHFNGAIASTTKPKHTICLNPKHQNVCAGPKSCKTLVQMTKEMHIDSTQWAPIQFLKFDTVVDLLLCKPEHEPEHMLLT